MMPRNLLFFILATGLITGCLPRSDQTRFYYLSAPASGPPAEAVEGEKVFLVGLRITSAEYLRTKEMLVEMGTNQLRLSEQNQWQEMPQAGFGRIVAGRFARKLPDCQLTTLPLATTNRPELELEIELRSLQGRLRPRSEAEVSAEVRILDANGRLLEREELRQTSPWSQTRPPAAYPTLAAAESRAAAELADAIGEKVLEWHRRIARR
jgi:uncharacterized lipoprotein YmbA